MKTRQQGFTLIELVVVIVILGILAATAIPRYVNYTSQARIASLNGVIGAINSAVAIAQGRYISLGTNPALITAIDTTTVAVDNGTTPPAAGGLPLATTAGICNAVSLTGFACVNGTFDLSPSVTSCNVVYAHTAGTTTYTVTPTTSGC